MSNVLGNILLTVAYDGTNFFGFQKQKDARTIQKTLEIAISKLFKKDTKIFGSSRTDAGVHALCQLILFEENTNIPLLKLPLAINSHLKTNEIVVVDAVYVPKTFHPQISVIKKTYKYNIYNAPHLNPLFSNYAEFIRLPLNIENMKEASEHFLGCNDFKSFCATGGSSKTTIRTIYNISITKNDSLITIEITGNGFLYNMVRIIAGTLIEIGQEKRSPSEIPFILKSKNRINAGVTASACGLILHKIYYNI